MTTNGVWQMQQRLLHLAITSNRVSSGTAMRVFAIDLGRRLHEPNNV